ncbi:hypothetical protein VNO78_09606 [Psophocarpus tetragonolobus]|uniref:Uncharacterized protein n=1 Tax=Psophocarpus tetragonolobus TaxID=3891 RepID=A0AAN9SWL7_PSOTE
MEDVITEAAPPSRFLEEDLNIFTPPSAPLPSPFLIFPHNTPQPLNPSLLIVALSPSSLSLFHPSLQTLTLTLTLTASLILPERPLSPLSLLPLSPSALLASSPSPVPAARSSSVARALLSLHPSSVLILDSLLPRHFRARLSSDPPLAFKLETSAERAHPLKILPDLPYYPSGSVVDGLSAAILSRCQLLNIRASLCVSWPEFDVSVLSLIKGLLQGGVLKGFDFGFTEAEVSKFGRSKDRVFHSELYI